MFVARRYPPPFTEPQLRTAVRLSSSWSETVRCLGLGVAGNNYKTVQKYVALWGIPTDHFDPYRSLREYNRQRRRPLEELLVEHSNYKRHSLKRRLFAEGLKERQCEMCGQGEDWNGRRMSLILDHVNGVPTDNRLENLRIVCPNCAATLDTHCGRKRPAPEPRACLVCDQLFEPRYTQHRYCSLECVGKANVVKLGGVPRPERRKVERPPYDELMKELASSNYSAVGRKYGVSDNAVRKWVRWYEAEQRRAA